MPDLHSAVNAAKLLGVSKKTLLKWCREKRISYIRYPGGEFRFRQSVIDIFLERHTVRAINAPVVWAEKTRAA